MKSLAVSILLCAAVFCRSQTALSPPVIAPAGGEVESPVLLLMENPNPAGVVFYTLNGGDPRDAFGNVRTNALLYRPASGEIFDFNNPVSVNRSMVVRARVKSGADWSGLAAAAFTVDQDFSKLLFTEVMYHPTALNHTPRDEEFIELKNVGDVPLDVSRLRLVDMTEGSLDPAFEIFGFPDGSVVYPGEFVVLAYNTNSFHALYPGAPIDGVMKLQLSNHLGRLALVAPDGAIATQMRYETHAPWAVVPDNHRYFLHLEPRVGFSLVRRSLDPSADAEHFSSWRSSARRLGSPGADDPDPGIPPILINELLTRSGGAQSDAVELFNPTATNVSVGGWWLSDERNQPYRYLIPPDRVVPAQGYLVLDESDFNSGTNSLSFSSDGERCYLFSGDADGNLTGYSHGFLFKGSDRDVSFGRHRSAEGDDYLLPQTALTFGAPNSGPNRPPLMITEIMYHPDGDGIPFVEVRNTGAAPLALWDPDLADAAWGLGTVAPGSEEGHAPSYFFPINTVLAPGAYALCVAGNVEVFRTLYTVPEEVQIFELPGWFLFPTTRASLRIYRPDGIRDAGGSRYIVVDETRYQGQWPWAPGAAGGGQSLERMNLTLLGNDPFSWRACPTGHTAGRPDAGNLPPQVWVRASGMAITNRALTLLGEVFDDRWPGTQITSWWSQVDGPAPVTFESGSSASVKVRCPEIGSYRLRFTGSDGLESRSEDISVEAVSYPFNSFETIETRVTSGHLLASWTQRSDLPDDFMILEVAHRIEGPWFGGSGLVEVLRQSAAEPDLERITVRSLLPAMGARRQFIRLRLSL